MTGDLSQLYDGFTSTAFRLERWQHYAVPAEDASWRAFREGLPRPERSVRTSPWLARIAADTAAGKRWSRVRVVEWPLTGYTRYELLAYVESQAVGEQIGLVDHDDVRDLGPDFWLFDGGTDRACAAIMHYGPDGAVVRRELVTDPDRLAQLVSIRETAEQHARPLNLFLADERCRA